MFLKLKLNLKTLNKMVSMELYVPLKSSKYSKD